MSDNGSAAVADQSADQPQDVPAGEPESYFDVHERIHHKTLLEAKAAVMVEVEIVRKVKSEGLSYQYAPIEAMVAQVRPSMIRNGLTIRPSSYRLLHNEAYVTTNNKSMNRVVAAATFVLSHVDSDQTEEIDTLGEGADNGDKSCNKAMTAALKYALKQAFLIPTEDDPDKNPSDNQERGRRGQSSGGGRQSSGGRQSGGGDKPAEGGRQQSWDQKLQAALDAVGKATSEKRVDTLVAEAKKRGFSGAKMKQIEEAAAAARQRLGDGPSNGQASGSAGSNQSDDIPI